VRFDAFSDIDVSIVRVLAQAEDVALEVVLRATNSGPLDVGGEEPLPPTGRRIELPAVWFLRLDSNGKIVEERDYFDTANFFRQLGLAGDT
jgi:predicted ester cyclase